MRGFVLKTAVALTLWSAPGTVAAQTGTAIPLGDPAHGAEVFQAECARCHILGEGARNRIGPQLNDIFDRGAGALDDFAYSRSMRRMHSDGLLWTLQTLDAYLENPRALVSGTRMAYRGLGDETDRHDVLAFLRQYSAQPQDIPSAAPTALSGGATLSPEILSVVGDPAYGEYLSAECTTCHRLSGDDSGIPSIIGWPVEDFLAAMHAYKDELRPHPVMRMMAQRLDNEQIASLAAYFASVQPN